MRRTCDVKDCLKIRSWVTLIGFILNQQILAAPDKTKDKTKERSTEGIYIIGDEPSYIDLGAGAFNITGEERGDTLPMAFLEFRYGGKLLHLGPAIGLLMNSDDGLFGYGSVYADIGYKKWVAMVLFGIGGYSAGSRSVDLGGVFQFRLSLSLAYEFDNHSRLGLRYAHISNGGMYNYNPGENEVLVSYAIPL